MQLAGPWPRCLTFEEYELIKAHVMLNIENQLMKQLEIGELNLNDQFRFTYILNCGTPKEKDERVECGAIPPNGGSSCRQQKNHEGQHSSVFRW